jgi:hypothetical protein
LRFQAPVAGFAEKVFYHDLSAGADGGTAVALLNEDCAGAPLGVVMRLNRRELGCFTEWKMPRQGFYVLGLEPGTINPDGRGPTRAASRLPMIEGLGRYDVEISLDVVEGRAGLDEAERIVAGLSRG